MSYKICVYAIAKNEIKFIDRWYESIKEADYICVLDTGSSDGSYEKLKSLGIITKQIKFENFRFDIARNISLELIPEDADICVCVDIDEVFIKGWSEILRKHWTPTATRARYRYTWSFHPDGSEGVVFMSDKIHKNKIYHWKYPVHEILSTDIQEEYINIPSLQLNHHADNTKSRSSYLPLLELSSLENPNDDRTMHYLGREYLFYGKYTKAIKTLNKHLSLPTANWKEERSASLRFIGRCYERLKKPKLAETYYIKAILEDNSVREPYFELAVFYYNKGDYLHSIFVFEEMLKIKDRTLSYISSPDCWNGLTYDYLSIAYWKIGNIKKAISNVEIALTYDNNPRLIDNRNYFYSLMPQIEN